MSGKWKKKRLQLSEEKIYFFWEKNYVILRFYLMCYLSREMNKKRNSFFDVNYHFYVTKAFLLLL